MLSLSLSSSLSAAYEVARYLQFTYWWLGTRRPILSCNVQCPEENFLGHLFGRLLIPLSWTAKEKQLVKGGGLLLPLQVDFLSKEAPK